MTEAAIIALAIALATAIVAFLVFASRESAAVHNEADARVAQTATEGLLERSQFELETTKKALDAATARAAALETSFAEALNDSGPDLDPRDIHGRLVRLAKAWGQSERSASTQVIESPAGVPSPKED